jgi:hypothetical protein
MSQKAETPMTADTEPSVIKASVSAFLKPFQIVTTPIAERVAGWLKRKPQLHVRLHTLTALWCRANENVTPG